MEGTLGWCLLHGVIKWACINWYTGEVKLKGRCDTLHSCVSSWPCPHPSAQQREVSVLPSPGDMALQEGAGSWSPLGPGSWDSLLHFSSRLRRLKQLLFMHKCSAVESFPQERRAAWKAEVSFQMSTSRDRPVRRAGCWAGWVLYIFLITYVPNHPPLWELGLFEAPLCTSGPWAGPAEQSRVLSTLPREPCSPLQTPASLAQRGRHLGGSCRWAAFS